MSPRLLVGAVVGFFALELSSIVLVSAWFGAFVTFFAIALGFLAATLLIRRAGFQVARQTLAGGGVLDPSLLQGSGRMIGAALLFGLPGFLSDLIAIGLLVSPRRPPAEPVARPAPGDVVDLRADEFSRTPEPPRPGVSRGE